MISVTDLRSGTKVEMDGGLWQCVEYQHQKIGRGGAKVVAKFRNLETGVTVEKSFNSGEKLQDIYVETKDLQYLYSEGDELVLMDLETYEQFHVPRDITEAAKFLKEGMTVVGEMYQGRPLSITPPFTVELKIIDTPPACAAIPSREAPSRPRSRPARWSKCPFLSTPVRPSRWIPAPGSTSAEPDPPHPPSPDPPGFAAGFCWRQGALITAGV